MILYTITLNNQVRDWAGTQADAKAAAKELQSKVGDDPVSWQEAVVPVDKPALLAWLKENALGEKRVKRSAETPHLKTPQMPSWPGSD